MEKDTVKSIVYCPYEDCINYKEKGKNIKILSLKNNRFQCKVCQRTFKFEIKYHTFISENNLDLNKRYDDLKTFVKYLIDEYTKNGKLENLMPKLKHSKDPLIRETYEHIVDITNNVYEKYVLYIKKKYSTKNKIPETVRLWMVLNDIKSINNFPKCEECGENILVFKGLNKGFGNLCKFCVGRSKKRISKVKQTCIERYGYDHHLKNKDILRKQQKTLSNKYGGIGFQSPIIKEKFMITIKERYGANSYSELRKTNNDKIKKTNIKRYGVECPLNLPDKIDALREILRLNGLNVKHKLKRKYGVENPSQLPKVKEKKVKNCLLKYGVENPNQINIKNYEKYHDREFIKNNFISDDGIILYDEMCKYFGIRMITAHRQLKKLGLYKRVFGISKFEKDVEKFIVDEIGIPSKDIICNDRSLLGNKYEIDLLIPKLKIGIECDGIFWHSYSKKSKHPLNYYKTNVEQKKKIGLSKGVNILFVQEIHWKDKFKCEIIKSILRTKLGKCKYKQHARKLHLIEVEASDLYDFFNENHLDGYAYGSSIAICLVNDDSEIISAMLLGKPRYRDDIEWEIFRFATKRNTICNGAFSKMLKYFTDKYKPRSILTYADLSIFDGKTYKKTGFLMEGFIEPAGVAVKINILNNDCFEIEDEIPLITFKYKSWKEVLKNKLELFNSDDGLISNLIQNNYHIYFRPGSISFVKYL